MLRRVPELVVPKTIFYPDEPEWDDGINDFKTALIAGWRIGTNNRFTNNPPIPATNRASVMTTDEVWTAGHEEMLRLAVSRLGWVLDDVKTDTLDMNADSSVELDDLSTKIGAAQPIGNSGVEDGEDNGCMVKGWRLVSGKEEELAAQAYHIDICGSSVELAPSQIINFIGIWASLVGVDMVPEAQV